MERVGSAAAEPQKKTQKISDLRSQISEQVKLKQAENQRQKPGKKTKAKN
jgi:hypothetical protein